MVSQLSTNGEALRLFFTEDIYFVNEPSNDGPATNEHIDSQQIPAEVIEKTVDIAFKYLGKNKRNILILVNDGQNDVSDEIGRELLRKIVKSINLSADDFALLNYASYSGTSFQQLKSYFKCELVFSFGVSPAMLSLNEHPHNTVINEEAVKVIFSEALPLLNEDANGKKSLWACLKNLGI